MKCDSCGKGIMIGHNVSHAKNRTRKVFKPNLHSARIWMGTGFRKMKLCTKCQRLLKKRSLPSIRPVQQAQGKQAQEEKAKVEVSQEAPVVATV